MPWCPKCKNEYVEGITVCADCGTELVDSLEITETEEIIKEEILADDEKSVIEEIFSGENPEDAEEKKMRGFVHIRIAPKRRKKTSLQHIRYYLSVLSD